MAQMNIYQRSRVKTACWFFMLLAVQALVVMGIRRNNDGWQTVVISLLGAYLLVRAMNEPTTADYSN
jgi:hypothetical protein